MDSFAIAITILSILFLFFLLTAIRHWIFLLPGFIGMPKDELSRFDEIKISRITGTSGMLFSGSLIIIFIFFREMSVSWTVIVTIVFIAFNIGIAFKTAINDEWVRKG